MDNTKTLTIERIFDAPRELVWKAWTDPELIKQWWGPRMVTIPVCEVDAKVGGKLNIVMEAGKEMGEIAGTQWPMDGEFTEVIENKKLVYKGTASDNGMRILWTTTTVTFEAEGDPTSPDGSGGANKTKLTVHIEVTKTTPEAANAIAGMEMGWNQMIDKLGEFLMKEGMSS